MSNLPLWIFKGPCLSIRGTIRLPPDALHPDGRRIVIQGATEINATHRDHQGNLIMICDFVPPTDRKSPGQMAQRARMRHANAAWHVMPEEGKKSFEREARQRKITTYNAAISWLLKQPDLGPTDWDNASSIWDNGNTTWD